MKKMWKRFVSLLLACTLLAGMLPLSASAQATAPGEGSLSEWVKSKISELSEEDYTQAGPFPLQGSDLYQYTFTKNQYDNEGNLTQDAVYIILPGIGAANTQIPDYGEDSSLKKPWGESNASAVYIAKGVTGIGNHAFDGMTTLETLEIENPTSLKSVGDYAFNGCDKLVGPLDLSGVTDMGKYAFNGCERLGSGEDNEGVKLSDSLTEIPEYAFNGCGLKNVNIPTNCTEIGNNAFANNSLSGELNLPSSLITIGERAFYRYNSSSDTGGFSSITIPSSVTKIGANAFSGHKSLETVTLEHEDKENLTIADGAFGTDTYTAHNYLDSITVGDITYEDVHMGTQFLTKNNVGELLNNGVNCYLGDLKPLEYERTVLPTCMVDGYYLYTMTLENVSTDGKPVTIETQIPIQHPGHDYEDMPDLPATCIYPKRTLKVCTNVKDGLVKSCEAPRLIENIPGSNALGHDYQVTNVTNPTISNNNSEDTVITYTCANAKYKLHDGDVPAECSWKIEPVTLTASTSHTLKDLESMLPAVTGVEENMPYAHLEWNENEGTQNALLKAGTPTYKVKLVVTGTQTTFPSYSDENFKITVQVDKIKLDFSDVTFINSTRYTGLSNRDFDVQGLPEGVTIGEIEYQKEGESNWVTTQPLEASADDAANYKVRVHFTYDSSKYLMPGEDETSFLPDDMYKLEGENGEGTITGDYIVRALQPEDLTATPKTNLVYNGQKRATATIGGLPQGAKVTVTWEEKGEERTETIESAESSSYDVAKITDAGTYDITITVEHGAFVGNKAEVKVTGNIAKQTVITPIRNTNLQPYTPGTEQTGVPGSSQPDVYKVENNKHTNAGTYQATATLSDPDNYKWSTSEEAAVQISYTIPRRMLTKPALTSDNFMFRGESIMPLQRNNKQLSGKFDQEGNLKAYWTNYGEEHVAYTATNAQKTDVGTYTITVSLNNEKAQNYWWDDRSTENYTLKWTIIPMSIQAPEVEVKDATYTGEDYDADSNIHMTGSSEYLSLGTEHTYYRSSTGTPLDSVPKDAGTYYVQVDFDFKGGLNPENYTITGNNRQRFTIEKAELTLTEPENEVLTASFTGQNMPIPAPGVSGLQKEGDEYTLTYTYTFTPAGSEEAQSPVESSKAPEVSAAGIYEVKVTVPDTCQNYRATEAVTYTFRITSATQRVELESSTEGWNAEQSTVSKTLGDVPFTVTGKGYVNDVVVNEKDISYEVTGENTQNPVVEVDQTSGQVTLLRAGSATITVTAEGSANYQKATASYTITVDKGTPEVTVQMPGGGAGNTYPYTGKKLTFTAAVTGAGNGAVAPTTDKMVTYKFYNNGEGDQLEGEALANQPTGIGTYWVEAVYAGDDNYNPKTSEPVQFTISPAALEVEANGYTGIYNGQPHDPVESIQVTGVDGVISPEKYTISYAKKTSDQPPEADGNWSSTLQVKDVAHSGDYWIKVVIDGDDSSYAPYVGKDPITVTINPRPLKIERKVTARKPYDGKKEATVEFKTINTGVDGETVKVTDTRAEYNSPNVEHADTITITYKLTAEDGTNLANYSLDGEAVTGAEMGETVTEGVGITPASITVAINDQTSVYDGEEPDVAQGQGTSDGDTKNWYVSEGTIYNSDNLGITLSIDSDSDAKDAGAYAIIGKWTNSNYTVTFTGNWKGEDANEGHAGTYTIDPRPISVQIGNADGFYGDAPVKPSGLLSDNSTEDGEGLVEGDSLDQFLDHVVINASPNTDVGSHYTITGTSGEYGNYNVTFASGTYTVKPRPITITIKDHRSKYGAAIDDGIATPVFDTDYTVAITNQATTGDAIVKGDNLEIKLTTKATADSPVDDYDITGSAEGEKVNNYAITWAGNGGDRDGGGKNGKYTIDKAGLKVEFDHHDKVLNGVSINITDSYNANPLVLKNASTDAEVSKADKETLDITYSIGAAGGGAGGVSQIAEINETTGEVTIHSTGTVRVTATVTPQGSSNYTGTQTTWYELNIISGGQMALTVTPKTNLAYTGDPQALLESASCSLDSAEIQYSLDNQDWGDEIPEGTNAGTYTVYVKATDPSGQYSDVTEHVTVTIDKADLKGRFARDPYPHVLATGGNRYDSAQANPLTITSQNYNAEPANYTYYSDNMQVASSANGTSTIVITGTAGESATIRVTVPGDNNYNEGTFTYTLEISDDLSKIEYSVGNQEVTYNGQPQTIAVKVSEPDSGATVMYWNEKASAYDLSEPPAYTDVQAGGYPIKFQITAPGYEAVTDEATLKIEPKDISQCKVEGIAESYTYVGHQIVPETVAVVDGSVILTKDTDYTLEYGANQEVGEGEGSVIIKGTGNYTGKVIEYFDIIPVDGSSGITASIAPNFGTYDPDAPVTAEVTVTHQTGSDSHDVDLTAANAKYTISATDLVTGQAITDHGATGTGGTLTFTKPAIYDITLTLTGDHQGEFRLSYTLLPLSNDDGGLTLTVDDETQKVFTYGGEIDPSDATIKVTANNTDVTDQCTLTYVYTPFEGTPTTTASPYTAEVLENAGVYTVTATPTDGSAITGTGTFTFLILQRDLSEANLTVEDSGLVYNQKAQMPSVTVAANGDPVQGTDYTITYYNNVNASDAAKAVVTATGNNFTGSKTAEFTIAPKPITDCVVENIPDQFYTGEPVIPPVTIKDSSYTLSYTLILGYDYTTACADKGPGEATVTITGTGNYTGEVEKTFTIKSEGAPEPSERFDLVVTPSQWTWEDDLTNLRLSVTFGTDKELTLGTEYTLEVNGQTFDGTTGKTKDNALTYIKGLKPGKYTITATGMDAYAGSTDTETVTIQKIQPTVTVTATPNSLSGGGKVTLTLKGEKLPAFAEGKDLSDLLTVKVQNGQQAPDLTELEWTENPDGSLTAELTLPNTNETYTFALRFAGNEYYEPASSNAMVVVGQQTSGGGGGSDPGDQPADPDDTGVSDWLNTKDHLAYLAGYPGGTFGPDQNMTRAEAAQMFYNLLLEKDVEITVEFEDVPADAWYAKPVNTLASLGILSGVGNGRFDPERSITRAEFTVIAMKFANTSGGGVNIFSDVNEDDWFYSAVVDSTQYGWINGYPDGTFRPEATISRAEVTVIVNHMLGRAADRPYVIAHEEELNTFGDVNRGHWGYFHVAEATNAHEYHTEDGTESWTGLS